MLFSFLMITYNQERYIEAALRSALAQDFEELEIVVSDDNSTDQTFEIALKIAEEYRGPFKIILNKNKKNLGIGCNFYKAFTLSHGEWLFMAAGDDISYSYRCKYIQKMIDAYPVALAFGAIRDIIDGQGTHLGYCTWHDVIHGASATWHRSLFENFPPIESGNMSEDMVLYFRAFLLNGAVVQCFHPVIQYRMDGLSNRKSKDIIAFKTDLLSKKEKCKMILHNNRSDLEYVRSALDEDDFQKFSQIIHYEFNDVECTARKLGIFISIVRRNIINRVKNYIQLRAQLLITWREMILIEITANPATNFLYRKIFFEPQQRNRFQFAKTFVEKNPEVFSKDDFLSRKGIFLQ